MSKEIRAQILDLSASILMGKATRTEIERVSKLARDGGEFELFKQEIKDCNYIIDKIRRGSANPPTPEIPG